MKNIWKLMAIVAIFAGLAACKKDETHSKNYFTIGDETYEIAQAAGYLDVDGSGYDFFLTSDPELKITQELSDPDAYKKALYIDVPYEKMGKRLTIGEDNFDGDDWDYYLFCFDENGTQYGSGNSTAFSSGYFESSLKGTKLTLKWDLVHNGVRMTGQYSGRVSMKDFYIVALF